MRAALEVGRLPDARPDGGDAAPTSAGATAAPSAVRVDGGMVANDWLCQFLADILDVPVERPAVTETTALGAACLAGLEVGLYPSLEALAGAWRCERRFEPQMSARRARAPLRRLAGRRAPHPQRGLSGDSCPSAAQLRVALAGFGAIGGAVARRLDRGLPGLRLVAVSARDVEQAKARLAGFARPVPVVGLGQLAEHAEVVVECAPAAVFREIAEPAIRAGRIFLPVSVGQLLEQADLIDLAARPAPGSSSRPARCSASMRCAPPPRARSAGHHDHPQAAARARSARPISSSTASRSRA